MATLTIQGGLGPLTATLLTELDVALAADDYPSLSDKQRAFAAISAECLVKGDLAEAIGWAELAAAAKSRIVTLLDAREAASQAVTS